MAEQPIKGTDIVEKDPLSNLIKQTDEAIVGLANLREEGLKTLNSLKSVLSGQTFNGSKALKEQQAATNAAKNELIKLEQVEQQIIKTQLAKTKLLDAQDRQLKQNIATEQAFEKALQKEAQTLEKTSNQQDKLGSLYSKLSAKLNATRKEYKDLALQKDFGIKLTEKEEIRLATLEKRVKTYNDALTKVDAKTGQYQRNVGNYKSGFDGLGNSVNQLTREFPAFAVSVQTGLLAISNNLPTLFDELKRINKENQILISQGKPVESALKQVAGAVFSIGSLLSLGITLLTVYGSAFVKFAVDAVKSIGDVQKETVALNTYLRESKERIEGYLETQFELFLRLKVALGLISKEQKFAAEIDLKYSKLRLDASKKFGEKIVAIAKETGVDLDELENGYAKESLGRTAFNANAKLAANKRFNAERKKAEIQFQKELKEIIVNEGLEKDLAKTEGDGSKLRQRYTEEELIKKRSAIDEIRQLQIDAIDDERERELAQIAFDEELQLRKIEDATKEEIAKKQIAKRNYLNEVSLIKANVKDEKQKNEDLKKLAADYQKEIKKIEAENISPEEQARLSERIQIASRKKRAAVNKKFDDEEQKYAEDREAKRTAGLQKQADDRANFEISLEQKKYDKLSEKITIFNVDELNKEAEQIAKLEQQQRDIEEERLISLADTEEQKEAIRQEYRLKKEKADADLAKKEEENDKKALQNAAQFSSKVLDIASKEAAEQANLKQKAFDKEIADTEKNIDTQRRLAEAGKANTLAETEAEKAQLELRRQQEAEKQIKIQEGLAFLKLISGYAEKDPKNALFLALRDITIEKAIRGAFWDGTEKVEDDLRGNKYKEGRDGYVVAVDGSERIMTGEQNRKVGAMSNEELADLAHKYQAGMLDPAMVKINTSQPDNLARNIQESALLMQTIQLNKRIESLENTIKNRPVTKFEFTPHGDFITTTLENGMRKVLKEVTRKPRI